MQLLFIVALLLIIGKSGSQELLNEVTPMLESIGGDEMLQAVKSAEEFSSVLQAVKSFTGNVEPTPPAASAFAKSRQENEGVGFPLAPIANIADRSITYSLSRYISSY